MEVRIPTAPISPLDSIPLQVIYPSGKGFKDKYKTKAVRGCSVAQMVFGALMAAAGILDLSLSVICWYINCSFGYGIWSGFLNCLSSVVGMCSVKFHPHRNLVISYMVMSIISATVTFFPFMFSLSDVIRYQFIYSWERTLLGYYNFLFPTLVLICSIAEIALFIVTASLCCKAVCMCCDFAKTSEYAIFDQSTHRIVLVPATQAQGVSLPGDSQEAPNDFHFPPQNGGEVDFSRLSLE